MSIFGYKQQVSLLGLDISSTSVKLLAFSKPGQVAALGAELLPDQAVVERNIKDVDKVADTIARLVSRLGVKCRHAAVAVAGSAVITRTIELPAGLAEDELADLVQVEASEHLPFPADEVALDFAIQEPLGDGRVEVLVAACRREHVQLRERALEKAGLVPKIVDIEAYCMQRACSLMLLPPARFLESSPANASLASVNPADSNQAGAYSPGTSFTSAGSASAGPAGTSFSSVGSASANPLEDFHLALVDIGATMTTLVVLKTAVLEKAVPMEVARHDMQVVYMREHLFGSRHFAETINRCYGISLAEMEMSRGRRQLPEEYESVVEPFRHTVLQEVTRALQVFYSTGSCQQVDQIILAGGTAGLDGLAERTESSLGIGCLVANPFAGMNPAPGIAEDELISQAPAMMIACGLAQRGLD